MVWRFAVAVAIILIGMHLSETEAATQVPFSAVSARSAAGQFENDNNVLENLFQNFNGNESSDGGHKKKETVGPLPAPVSAPLAAPSATQAQRRARAGRETVIFLKDDRVVVRVPASMPDDLEVTIQIVNAPAGAPLPGPAIGGLIFGISADAFSDVPPDRFPIEVNLSARYTDAELGSHDESRLVLSWLDPADNSWKPAPKPANDPGNNYMSATIQNLGVYAVHQRP